MLRQRNYQKLKKNRVAFELKKNPAKVQICGTGSGQELAPDKTDRVIYALNDFVKYEKYKLKPDILFILDILDEKPQIVSGVDNLGDIVKRINDFGVPLIAPFPYEEIPLSLGFPLERCAKEFGKGAMYFSNTISYMIAYALMSFIDQERAKGIKNPTDLSKYEIHIYGVNQAGSHEYAEERGSVEFWIGIAIGKGVKVIINGKDSQLLRYKGRYGRNGLLYGYLSSFDEVMEGKKKFGEQVIRKLSAPPKPFSRNIREVN